MTLNYLNYNFRTGQAPVDMNQLHLVDATKSQPLQRKTQNYFQREGDHKHVNGGDLRLARAPHKQTSDRAEAPYAELQILKTAHYSNLQPEIAQPALRAKDYKSNYDRQFAAGAQQALQGAFSNQQAPAEGAKPPLHSLSPISRQQVDSLSDQLRSSDLQTKRGVHFGQSERFGECDRSEPRRLADYSKADAKTFQHASLQTSNFDSLNRQSQRELQAKAAEVDRLQEEVTTLRAQIAALQREAAAQQREDAALQRESAALQAESKALQNQLQNLQNIKSENAQLKSDVQRLNQTAQALQSQIARMRDESEAASAAAASTATTLVTENALAMEELRCKSEALAARNNQLVVENNQISGQNQQLIVQNQKLTAERNALADSESALRVQLQQNVTAESGIETLRARMAELEKEIARTNGVNEARSQEIAQLKQENAGLRGQLEAERSASRLMASTQQAQTQARQTEQAARDSDRVQALNQLVQMLQQQVVQLAADNGHLRAEKQSTAAARELSASQLAPEPRDSGSNNRYGQQVLDYDGASRLANQQSCQVAQTQPRGREPAFSPNPATRSDYRQGMQENEESFMSESTRALLLQCKETIAYQQQGRMKRQHVKDIIQLRGIATPMMLIQASQSVVRLLELTDCDIGHLYCSVAGDQTVLDVRNSSVAEFIVQNCTGVSAIVCRRGTAVKCQNGIDVMFV